MGIPRLFRQICSRYPMTKTTLDMRLNYTCNNLFIDATTLLIHGLMANPPNSENPATVSEDMIRDTLFLFDSLVHLLQPTDLIFITTEGPSPNAKVWQARQRVFIRKITKFPLQSKVEAVCYDFEERIIDFVKEKSKTDELWRRPKIIFGGAYVPGEAEQKFIDYIRAQRSKPGWNPNQKHCIFTPDSNLILLALQTHEPFTTVCYLNCQADRKPGRCNVHGNMIQITPESLNLIDISLLRKFLMYDMKDNDERIINDFIAIMTVLGTDFYPHPDMMFNIKELIKSYHSRSKKGYIVKDGVYDMELFKDFLLTILNKIAKSKNMTYEEYCEQEFTKFAERNCSIEEERELSFCVLDAFNWTLSCYTKGVPSWTWTYKTYFAPPLCVIIEYIDEYKPSFKTDDPPPSYLFDAFISVKPKTSIMPENLLKIRETDPYMKTILPHVDALEKDEYAAEGSTVIKVPSVDYYRVMEIFKENIKKLPRKYNKLIEPHESFDVITGKSIDCTSSISFQPIDLSTEIPEEVPDINSFEVSIQTVKEETKFGVEEHVIAVPTIRDVPALEAFSFLGKVVYVNWPYKIPAVVLSSFAIPHEKTVAGFNLPALSSIVTVQMLDETYSHAIGEPFDYPAGLLLPLKEKAKIKKGETVIDIHERKIFSDEGKWRRANDISRDLNVPQKYVINAIKNVHMEYVSYSLQLLSNRYVIPGFTMSINKGRFTDVLISKDIVPNIEEYINTVPNKYLEIPIVEVPDPSLCDIAAPLINKLAYVTPWIASAETKSFNHETFKEIDEYKDTLSVEPRKVTYHGYTKDFKLGDHVMIINNKTVAPKGTIGTVIANDPIYKELWLVCSNFDKGITFMNNLNTRSGLIVSYTHVMLL